MYKLKKQNFTGTHTLRFDCTVTKKALSAPWSIVRRGTPTNTNKNQRKFDKTGAISLFAEKWITTNFKCVKLLGILTISIVTKFLLIVSYRRIASKGHRKTNHQKCRRKMHVIFVQRKSYIGRNQPLLKI